MEGRGGREEGLEEGLGRVRGEGDPGWQSPLYQASSGRAGLPGRPAELRSSRQPAEHRRCHTPELATRSPPPSPSPVTPARGPLHGEMVAAAAALMSLTPPSELVP